MVQVRLLSSSNNQNKPSNYKAFGDFPRSLFWLLRYGLCANDTKMILFVENSVRKRLFSTENDGIIILATIDDIRYERAFGSQWRVIAVTSTLTETKH